MRLYRALNDCSYGSRGGSRGPNGGHNHRQGATSRTSLGRAAERTCPWCTCKSWSRPECAQPYVFFCVFFFFLLYLTPTGASAFVSGGSRRILRSWCGASWTSTRTRSPDTTPEWRTGTCGRSSASSCSPGARCRRGCSSQATSGADQSRIIRNKIGRNPKQRWAGEGACAPPER